MFKESPSFCRDALHAFPRSARSQAPAWIL